MRKFLFLVPLVGLSTACVYPAQSLSRPYPGQSVMYPRPVGPQVDVASLPIGRWDNVMMSGVGTPVMVLTMDGGQPPGEIVTATSDTLRLRVASGEVEIAAADVMRVDRLAGGPRQVVKDGARGAAFGAGVVGVLGLITGHVPPPRLFAAGGIVGDVPELELASLARGATTIYLAESAAPAVAAAVKAAGQSPAARVESGAIVWTAGGAVCAHNPVSLTLTRQCISAEVRLRCCRSRLGVSASADILPSTVWRPVNERRPSGRSSLPGRPNNGQTKLCPQCGTGTVEFNERYRLPGTDGRLILTAAWVCDTPQCGYHHAVRDKDPAVAASKLRMASMKLRAQDRRGLMRRDIVRQRASRTLSERLAGRPTSASAC